MMTAPINSHLAKTGMNNVRRMGILSRFDVIPKLYRRREARQNYNSVIISPDSASHLRVRCVPLPPTHHYSVSANEEETLGIDFTATVKCPKPTYELFVKTDN